VTGVVYRIAAWLCTIQRSGARGSHISVFGGSGYGGGRGGDATRCGA